MTRDERLALLGADVVAQIHKRVAEAPEPAADVVDDLRRILTRPARRETAVSTPRAA